MDRATTRLAELKGQTQVAAGERKRPWEAAVDVSQLPGSDRLELTRSDLEGKDKGSKSTALAPEFLTDTAEKGVARAKARM
ncbi:hypothetical protein CYMTET_44787 [Cymbomonas tetramitiformis]|uniref:Uncharacterized protein n=1 Tax=Cymbomonas tetramitiformis TaxID=36881 RepID=A0AAE0C0R8_9CHLO|nr:hypothetical protein CYMTET_44787 [Cymbomonas tetramitiformis]